MNELPIELKCVIFRYLDLTDLFDNCRLVCKNWLKVIDSMKFNELIISDLYRTFVFEYSSHRNFWYYTFQPINPANFVYIPFEWPNVGSFIIKHFDNLKYFKIFFNGIDQTWFNLNQLNNFINLEHLEIICTRFETTATLSLYLPNLRIFYFNFNSYQTIVIRDRFIIDAVKLEVLHCEMGQIKLVHPESIKFLEIHENLINDLNKFTNLKIYLNHLINLDLDDPVTILSKLPDCLEELHFEYHINSDLYTESIERINNFLMSLFKEIKSSSRRSILKLYFNGIEMELNKTFHTYFFHKKRLKLYEENYEQLKTLPLFTRLDFGDLIQSFNKSIPINFFSIFNNIQFIQASEEVNQDQFIWFINGCRNLMELKLRKVSFNQQFYDQLPKITNTLFQLILYELVEINFKFILEFKMLAYVHTDQHIPKKLALYLIKNTKSLQYFEYGTDRKEMTIYKNPRTHKFEISFRGRFNYEPELDEIHYCENKGTKEWIIS